MKAALLLFLATRSSADYVFTKTVNPSELQKEFAVAGCIPDEMDCLAGKCVVVGKDDACYAKTVASHVYIEPQAILASKKSTVTVLALKLKSGLATQEDKDQLLLALIAFIFGEPK